jgi:hypothetical protein
VLEQFHSVLLFILHSPHVPHAIQVILDEPFALHRLPFVKNTHCEHACGC